MKTWILCALLLLTASHARAEGEEIDVRNFELLDVIETTDGSVWKGVVIEQTPNVSYKIAIAGGSIHVIAASDVQRISKQRNREYRTARPSVLRDGGVEQTYEQPVKLPAPYARSGLRFDPELVIVFPTGVVGDDAETSFAPGVRVGFESMFGNIGVSGGGQVRFTYWNLQGETKNAAWLLETQLYGRAALHVGRAAPYVGLALGVDTNYVYQYAIDMSSTGVGFGMNLTTGLQLAVSPIIAFDLGADYHPGTDTISDMNENSVSYFALRVGATLRL
jgi:hypothetical protein